MKRCEIENGVHDPMIDRRRVQTIRLLAAELRTELGGQPELAGLAGREEGMGWGRSACAG